MTDSWKKHIIQHTASIKDAFQRIDELGIVNNDLFVVDEQGVLLGSLSDGDIRRGMLRGLAMNEAVSKAMFNNPTVCRESRLSKELQEKCNKKNIRFVPQLNENNQVVNVFDLTVTTGAIPVNAIIMAGGKGSRLLPLTEELPKPLLKVGDKPIIEHNIDRLINCGIKDIYISVNYKGEMLEEYFRDGSHKGVRIKYIREEKPMGTVGSVKLENSFDSDSILIMNSDILTDINFQDFYQSFASLGSDMCIACTTYMVDIPYAVFELENGSSVVSVKEKPTYNFHSNAGIYLLKKDLIDLIPSDCFFDITDLIDVMIKLKKKVDIFPILGYWLDIGKLEDFRRAQEDIRYLKL